MSLPGGHAAPVGECGACWLVVNALACRDACAEVRDVVVVDDERPGQHGLEGGAEAALGTPREVVVEVVALGPLRESGDVIRVVLIADDPDGLAAVVLEALAQDLQQQVGDIVPTAGLGEELVGDQGAHQRIPPISYLVH
jgi:hypothetical protein